MDGPNDIEVRLRHLESLIQWLIRMLRSVAKMARAAEENAGRGQSQPYGGGLQIFRALVTTDIPAPTNGTAAATNTGRATIQLMNPTTRIYATHPLFPTPQIILNDWPGSSTTATAGKYIKVVYDGQSFTNLVENC